MLNQLKQIYEQECARNPSSLIGPHRDDINIYLNDRPAPPVRVPGASSAVLQ